MHALWCILNELLCQWFVAINGLSSIVSSPCSPSLTVPVSLFLSWWRLCAGYNLIRGLIAYDRVIFFFPFHIDNRCLINIQEKNAPTVKRKNNVENDILFFRICKINAHLWFQRLNRKYNFLLFLVISKNNNRATNFYRNCSSRLSIFISCNILFISFIISFHFSYINTLRIYLRISFLLFLVHEMDKMINGRSQFIPRILLSRYFFE